MPLVPVTDPALLQQLNGGSGLAPSLPEAAGAPASAPQAAPAGMVPADPATAQQLDQLSAPITFQDRLRSLLGDPQAYQKIMAQQTAALRDSSVGGFVRGLRDPIDAGAAMMARGLSSAFPNSSAIQQAAQNTAATNQAAEQDYAQNWRQGAPPAKDWGRDFGEAAATLPLGFAMPGASAAGLGARLASGAATGAVDGALQPIANQNAPDFWSQVRNNAIAGGAAGAAGAGLMGALARAIQPVGNPEVQTLMRAGVNPTPGQMLGGAANRIEQGATSIPGAGDFIKNARRAAVVEFNRGAVNQALAPIGQRLEASPGTRDAMAEAQDKISSAYDQIVPNLGFRAHSPASTQMLNDFAGILENSHYMPAERGAQLRAILNGQVINRMSDGGGMTGQAFQDAKSALGQASADYLHSSSADERQLGGALLQAQVAMRNALRADNPAVAGRLSNIDNAYAHLLRVQTAAAKPGGEPGLFSPAQLQSAVRQMDPSLRKNAFAAGDALMQGYAEAGKNVLGSTVPDSGTPYRHAIELAAGLLGGHAAGVPEAYLKPFALGSMGLTGGTAALYSPLGRALAAKLLASRPAIAGPAAAGVRALSPLGSATLPAVTLGP